MGSQHLPQLRGRLDQVTMGMKGKLLTLPSFRTGALTPDAVKCHIKDNLYLEKDLTSLLGKLSEWKSFTQSLH